MLRTSETLKWHNAIKESAKLPQDKKQNKTKNKEQAWSADLIRKENCGEEIVLAYHPICRGATLETTMAACRIVPGAGGTTTRNDQYEKIYAPRLTTFSKQSKSYHRAHGKKKLHRCKEGLGRHALSLCPWRAYDFLRFPDSASKKLTNLKKSANPAVSNSH